METAVEGPIWGLTSQGMLVRKDGGISSNDYKYTHANRNACKNISLTRTPCKMF
jgi:hypothetical protein